MLSMAAPTGASLRTVREAQAGVFFGIFSQEGQKDRRVAGFTRRPLIFGSTQRPIDRLVDVEREFADCSSRVISACIEVHREVGPGLLEAIYPPKPFLSLQLPSPAAFCAAALPKSHE